MIDREEALRVLDLCNEIAAVAHDLPIEAFPITIQMFKTGTDEELVDERITIEEGPFVVRITGKNEREWQGDVDVHVTYGDGRTEVATPEDYMPPETA